MSYYPAALAKELLPTLLYLEAVPTARSDAKNAARSLTSLVDVDAFPSPAGDETYATCLRIAHESLRSEIENDPDMDDVDYVVADFVLDVLADNKLRSFHLDEGEIGASTGLLSDDVGLALSSLCGAGYFRAIRPSKLESELGIQAMKYVPQLDEALLNAHLHSVSTNGTTPDKVTIKGRVLVTYSEDEEGNLQIHRP